MFSIRKFFPTLLTILVGLPISAALADGYSTGYSEQVLDEPAARRALAEVPGFKMDDVWFATGNENYYKSPACITGRGIWAFTKPQLSSPGLYRGRVSFIEASPIDRNQHACNQMKTVVALSVPTASFIDPNPMRPEEASDGQVPGVFHVDGKIPDAALLGIAKAIPAIRDCFKSPSSCPFNIDKELSAEPAYTITPLLKVENLLTLDQIGDTSDGVRHYEMIFGDGGYRARALDIYYKGDSIVRISSNIEVVE